MTILADIDFGEGLLFHPRVLSSGRLVLDPDRDHLRPLPRSRDLKAAGTLGFAAIGEVEDDDWRDEVEPVLRETIAAGEKVRLLYLLGPRSEEVEGDAVGAEARFRARHLGSFERLAVVGDEDWMRPALATLSFLLPGQAKAFPVSELGAAKEWLAAEVIEIP